MNDWLQLFVNFNLLRVSSANCAIYSKTPTILSLTTPKPTSLEPLSRIGPYGIPTRRRPIQEAPLSSPRFPQADSSKRLCAPSWLLACFPSHYMPDRQFDNSRSASFFFFVQMQFSGLLGLEFGVESAKRISCTAERWMMLFIYLTTQWFISFISIVVPFPGGELLCKSA